ncbi:MAG TPA: recombinase family protein [Amycolatopsis sp.]|nr:recombinase family protein [Amycolatopsis sp.]
MTDGKLLPVGALVRISDARDEDTAGVERQEKDCHHLAAGLKVPGYNGVEIVRVYVENDTSAFKRKKIRLPDGSMGMRVVRPEFRRAVNDLVSEAIGGLIGYDLDRVARDPRDLEDLIDAVELTNALTRSVTGSLDLSTDAGITMARVMVAMANKSSRDSSRRIKRKRDEMAEDGVYVRGGRRRYGRNSDNSIRPEEAAHIKEWALRVLGEFEDADGSKQAEKDSLRTIARDFTARGIPTVSGSLRPDGKPHGWHVRTIHSSLTSGHVAGLIVHRGVVVRKAVDIEPILDRDLWDRVQIQLKSNSRGGGHKLKRWLSAVLVCAKCGRRLNGVPYRAARGRPMGKYQCWPENTPHIGGCGGTSIDAQHAHDTAEALILKYCSRPDVITTLSEAVSADGAATARDNLKADEQQLQELATMWGQKMITMPEYLAARREIDDRIKRWHAIVSHSMPSEIRELVTADSVEAHWQTLDPDARREVARVVFPFGIMIVPAKTKFEFDPDRLVKLDEPWSPSVVVRAID